MRSIDCQHPPSSTRQPLRLILLSSSRRDSVPLPRGTDSFLSPFLALLRIISPISFTSFSTESVFWLFSRLWDNYLSITGTSDAATPRIEMPLADAPMENLLHRDRIAESVSAISRRGVSRDKASYGIGISGMWIKDRTCQRSDGMTE